MELYNHQKNLISISEKNPRYCFFAEPGTGKTAVCINIYNARPMKTLVLCPINLIENAWLSDAEKFGLKAEAKSLWASTPKKRKSLISSEWDFGVINYESFLANKDLFNNLGIKRVILDESSRIKSHRAKITKAVHNLAWKPSIQECYLLSGTPAPNSKLEYYPQMRCVTKNTFPRTFTAFKHRYFYQYGTYTWQISFKKEMTEDFQDKLAQHSIFVKKSDCLDLPEKIEIPRYVSMTRDQEKFYRSLKEDWVAAHGDHVTIANTALVELMKLRQVTSGFVFPTTSKDPQWIGSNKESAIEDMVKDELAGEQVLIVCQFQYEIQRVARLLSRFGNVSELHGLIPEKDRKSNIDRFKDNQSRFMVVHPKSAGHGLTFTNCRYVVFMSQTYSLEEHDQVKDRIHRIGQERDCIYYHILARNTVDNVIYNAVNKKRKLADDVLEALKHGKI